MSERNMGMGNWAPSPRTGRLCNVTILAEPASKAKQPPSVSVVHTHTEPKPKAVSFRWRRDGRRAVRGTLSDPRARERQARFGRASGPARPCAGEAAVAPCRAYPFLFSPPSSSSVLYSVISSCWSSYRDSFILQTAPCHTLFTYSLRFGK
jgi:hypothetical protein